MRFSGINGFDIKAFLSFFPPFLFCLSYLSRYNKICDKVYIKIYDNICDKYCYYNKERFNNINKFNIKNIIIFFN